MFNFLGNHKIGIIGDANSGKTVLLTSLLWNLENLDLTLTDSKKSLKPTAMKVMQGLDKLPVKYRFDYEDNKRKLQKKNDWPKKTLHDYSLASCSYDLPGKIAFRQDIIFVDIPGERLADVLLWECSSYDEWAAKTLSQWRSSDHFSDYMKDYLEKEAQPSGEVDWNDLVWAFKTGMRNMMNNFTGEVSPSTLFFADGKVANEQELADDDWLRQRPIWKGGDFFPLAVKWKETAPKIYKTCKDNYKKYRKEVIKPIFSQIGSCDNFIYCVDIFDILTSGPQKFTRVREEIKSFVEKIVPGALKYFLKGTVGHNPQKIAFVATKSDTVYGENLGNLEYLLKDLVKPFDQGKRLPFALFTCTAWKSTRLDENGNVVAQFAPGKWCVLETKDLPEEFPENWNPDDFQYLATPIKPAAAGAKPPRQEGLDKILSFVTGI